MLSDLISCATDTDYQGMSERDRGTARLSVTSSRGLQTWNEKTKFAGNNPGDWPAVRDQMPWPSVDPLSSDDKLLFTCFAMGQRDGVDGQQMMRRDCHPAIPAPAGGRGGV